MGEWKRVKLGEICSKIGSGATPTGGKSAYKDNGVSLIRSQNVLDMSFAMAGLAHIDDEQARKLDGVTVCGGDVLLNITGDSVARCCIVPDHVLPARVNQHVCIVRPRPDLAENRFVEYFLIAIKDRLLTLASAGATRNALTKETIQNLEVSLPDLPTQRRIAAVLGALDDKIEVNRKICENLEAQAQALFKGMKRRAEESSFVQVIDILSGGTPKTSVPEYWNGGIPFFSPKDVGGLFTISTERNITDQGLANCNSILYPKGTTFVTARGTVGKVCLAGVPMAMNQSCFALASNEIDPLLVYFYTCASVDSLKSKANGSVFAAITIAEFETEKIHRLTDPEEERFVKTVRPMFDQILVRQQESRALAAMRDALLPKLMSGELAVEKVEAK